MHFHEFMTSLEESFNKVVPIRWERASTNQVIEIGHFTVAGNDYEIRINIRGDSLSASFTGEDDYGDQSHVANNRGNALIVFSTVIYGIRMMVDKHDPLFVKFSAYADVASRERLYDSLVRRFAKDDNYTYSKKQNEYTLVRSESSRSIEVDQYDSLNHMLLSLSDDPELVAAVAVPYAKASQSDLLKLKSIGAGLAKIDEHLWIDIQDIETMQMMHDALKSAGVGHLIKHIELAAS